MTPLEEETFRDGFRIVLLGCHSDPAQDILAARVVIFDGGRERDHLDCQEPYYNGDSHVLGKVDAFLRGISPPPAVAVVYGNGHRQLGEAVGLRDAVDIGIVDLRRAGASLADTLTRAAPEEIAGALGVRDIVLEECLFPRIWEDILWAVVASAGHKGLNWKDVAELADDPPSSPNFAPYGFDDITLRALPGGPGVYVMRDARGGILYVGKAANLSRRLQDYFRTQERIPDKLRAIRERIKTFDCHPLGSEVEALLLENRFIRELDPEINVQRAITPGSSRYRPLEQSVVAFCHSVLEGRLELFFFGRSPNAVQLRVVPSRPPRRHIRSLMRYTTGDSGRYLAHSHITDWGKQGGEICSRYWSRCRNSMHWFPLEGSVDVLVEGVAQAAAAVRTSDGAAEFRIGAENN